MTRAFLTAQWRHLLMINYAVDPALLRPRVPRGVELDSWLGITYLSLVGFLFQDVKVMGLSVPFHRDFEEVNLRFYVRRRGPEGWRRGVVFIKEIVPRALIATVARVCYNEPYQAMPMRHQIDLENGALRRGGLVGFYWFEHKRLNLMSARLGGSPSLPEAGSVEEFITEHYWGYTAQRNGGCKQYQVEHPRWPVWPAGDPVVDCDTALIYGPEFEQPLSEAPLSVFVAEGSAVSVGRGGLLEAGLS